MVTQIQAISLFNHIIQSLARNHVRILVRQYQNQEGTVMSDWTQKNNHTLESAPRARYDQTLGCVEEGLWGLETAKATASACRLAC
jgi:hypothetical protein